MSPTYVLLFADGTFGKRTGHPTTMLMYRASVILRISESGEYNIIKNKRGDCGKVSSDEALTLLVSYMKEIRGAPQVIFGE